jgi:cell division protein FtsW (lipid II flippase)
MKNLINKKNALYGIVVVIVLICSYLASYAQNLPEEVLSNSPYKEAWFRNISIWIIAFVLLIVVLVLFSENKRSKELLKRR